MVLCHNFWFSAVSWLSHSLETVKQGSLGRGFFKATQFSARRASGGPPLLLNLFVLNFQECKRFMKLHDSVIRQPVKPMTPDTGVDRPS